MTEARDRLPRPEDVAAIFNRRRRSIASTGVLVDEPERSTGTPLRFGNGRRLRNLGGSPVALGRENTPPVGVGSGRRSLRRGRGSNSVLPSWYPRTPLRDITAIVRAIERRRALLRESESREIDILMPQSQIDHDPSILPSDSHPDHEFFKTPKPKSPKPHTKHSLKSVGKVPKILLDITNQETGPSDALTPQMKLLDSIDKVEKVVMEELHKLKSTPTAKKAERDKKVRALMSMR